MAQKAVTEQKHLATKINRMEMKGFKSFATKVEVPFTETFNCILGPNGSGKSNVLDSLCFVLGKAGSKGLRAEKTANLIYNGGKQKKPASQGEVHIYFDNEHSAFPLNEKEIKISRVVKKNGSSTYLINDEVSTRTAVVDLLAHARINPDGYNIILQGDIVRLVEMSPNERRTIIEEISGINIYEDKKGKAQRELDRVEEQLKEADIVLAERNTYLRELKKERDQALKFKELDEKIKRNKATVIARKMKEREGKLADLQKKIDGEQKIIDEVQKKIDSYKNQILEKKKALDDISKEVEQKGEKDQVDLHKSVEQLKVDLAVKKERSQQVRQELTRMGERNKQLEQSRKDARSKIAALETTIASHEKKIAAREKDRKRIDDKIAAFRKKNDLHSAAEIDEEINQLDASAEKLQVEIHSLREEQQDLLRDKDQVEYRIQTIDEKIAKVLDAQKANKGQIKELKAKKSELTDVEKKLNNALDRASSLVPELQTAKGKLDTRQEELARLRARQASIQEKVAGSSAIKAVLDLKKKDGNILGTVAELGNVDDKYSLALEIAAGARLRSIVVKDDKTAQKCINYLKKNHLGVATFLPLNKLRVKPIPSELRTLKGKGVQGLAIDLVSFKSEYEKAFQHVLGSTLIVDNITSARAIGVGKARMVTLDGDLVEASGAMTGGHRARKKGSGLGFQEKQLTTNLAKLEREIADYQQVVSRLSSEQKKFGDAIETLRPRRHELESAVLALERELHIDSGDMGASKEDKDALRAEAKEFDKHIDEVIAEISAKNKELASLKTRKHQLREKITKLRSPQALAELNTFEQQKGKLGEEIVKIQTEKQALQNQIQNIHQPEFENINKILEGQDKEKAAFTKEQEEIKKTIQKMTDELKEKEKKEAAFRKQFKELFEKRNKLEKDKDRLEMQTINEEEKIRKKEHTLNASSIQQAQLKAELAGLEEENKEYKEVKPYTSKPQDQIQREIREFERMVDNMGAVNMKALEVYEHVHAEYESLVEKREVLETERGDVLVMINEIDAKKRELFMLTFDAIEKQFKKIFSQLSRKGEAFLELETPDDPFAGGLEIKVRLSGNKFMDIRSLSGGEKTMTALAFLFAIQEHEPASFYVLDEVDAALDKKNSESLARLVRAYCDKAQYIIISHNDTVISEADTLFGVSMNEHGESQVTSLKI